MDLDKNFLVIDFLRNDTDVIGIINGNKEYKFVNYLYYIKEVYDISITKLANFFGVSRQMFYRYVKDKETLDLPENVLGDILEVTGHIDMESFINESKKIFQQHKVLLPDLEYYVSTQMSQGNPDDANPYVHPEYVNSIFEMRDMRSRYFFESDGLFHLKEKYNMSKNWHTALREVRHKKVIERTTSINTKSKNDNPIEFLKSNSSEYNKLLLKVLDEKCKGDDLEFLMYLKKYTVE